MDTMHEELDIIVDHRVALSHSGATGGEIIGFIADTSKWRKKFKQLILLLMSSSMGFCAKSLANIVKHFEPYLNKMV